MKKNIQKEIFIFAAGSTPQIITETICALAIKRPPVYPDEIYVITTSRGKEIIEDALVKAGVMKQLVKEYKLPAVFLGDPSFIIPKDASGCLLEDIRNNEENEIMGDAITSFIREKTDDSAARLHCSLAGGRKTMSFYLGVAMQLFARPWDKLYHVLVSPEFESNPDFFYKPRKNKVLTPLNPPLSKGGHGGLKRLNTKDAEITLAELPFIRLKNKLQIDATAGFRELVEEGQKEIDTALIQPELRVILSEQTVQIGRKTVRMAPLQLVVYVAHLKQKLSRCRHPERPYCLDCTDCFASLLELSTKAALEEMAKDYMRISHSRALDFLHKYEKKDGLGQDIIRQTISKIKKTFSGQLGDETLALHFAVTSPGRIYGGTRYGVRAEKGKIRIE
jgi:CRISPR-associated protein Csx14